ncbi:MAG: competence/damage-inducible protein A [Alphaproteobacteria bacterium]|nr:competence/damage-inducible protein A [Alphaproteobacteria bacterium]MDE2336440.1 competence/damage-inducible protein A [Alphaproteobacteria bacterium]
MSAAPAPATAAILIIGNEILSGRTQDVNVKFIAERLAARGIRLCEVRVVPDDEDAVVSAVRALSGAYTYVFSTGGIGPTHDDITAACMAKAFGTVLEINAEAKARMSACYASKGAVMTEGRLRMARIPAGAALVDNPVSAAPGFKIENVYVMAGIPDIMQAMFLSLEPELAQGQPVLSRSVSGKMRESEIAAALEDIQNRHPDVEIGSYPAMGRAEPHVSLVLRATDEKKLAAATEEVLEMAKGFDKEAKEA